MKIIVRNFVLTFCWITINHNLIAQTPNFFPSSGNVGIGTSIPSHKLDVIGDAFLNGNCNVTGGIFSNNNLWMIGASGSTSNFIIANSGSLVITTLLPSPNAIYLNTSGGKVGIGIPANSNLLATLDVNGNVNFRSSLKIDGAVDLRNSLETNGRAAFRSEVGINSSPDPATALKISGAGLIRIPLLVEQDDIGPWGYNIKAIVSHPETKAISLTLSDSNPSTNSSATDPETFLLMGNGNTCIGAIKYDPGIQLRVETSEPVAVFARQNSNGTAYVAEISSDSAKAFSVVDARNPLNPVEVFKITGEGKLWSQEVRVRLAPFPDYVFDENYERMSLENLENYISANKKLPGFPSATEIEREGGDVGELIRLQQERIEELYLICIDLNNKINALSK